MGPDRDPDTDGDANLSYPSPGAEALDAGPFYNAGGRDGVSDHQDQSVHHNGDELHAGDADASHLHGEHDSQHDQRPTNLEELQLAAQLGQGLTGASILPATDPNMSVDDSGMRSIMPHPDADPHQSFVHDTPTSDHMVQHAMSVPPQLTPQYTMPDGIPPRKRSKVSRACDECRRKKIKCDAQSDTGEAPCSSCARSSIRCLFSRVPQKRGPSKGYIKELADRINSIENKLESEGNLTQDEIDRLFGAERPRASNGTAAVDDSSRKRPFSSISGPDFSTPVTARQAPWGTDGRSSQVDSFSAFGNSALAPVPSAIRPDETPSKTAPAIDSEMTDDEDLPEIDEAEFNDVFLAIQPVYPILPSSKEKMQLLLAQCPAPVKTAFVLALQAVGQTTPGDVKQASALLSEWETSNEPRSRAADIVHAQTLVLLTTDADWRALPSLPFLLSRAVALANTMKLWRFTPVEEQTDVDSEDMLAVRIWWSIVLLDRWNAAGTGSPAHIPDKSAVVPAGLENIVGEICFHYIRLSKLLNRIAYVISTLPQEATTADPAMVAILTDYIENYREDLPAHVDAAAYPLIHLAYWHCKLLITMLTEGATPAELLWSTKELTNLLIANGDTRSPLANHFAALAYMALGRLTKPEGTHEDALQLIKDASEPTSGGVWDPFRDKLASMLRPSSSAEAASQGLQHLADLATAHAPPAEGEPGAEGSLATGYLENAA